MQHCGTKTLETDRLILRKFTVDDAEAMYKHWASDKDVVKFLTWPNYENVDVAKATLENWEKLYEDDTYYQWAIVPKDLQEPVGSISAVGMKEEIDMIHIGYCIGRSWWHQGITSEALKEVIRFFFEEVGANRIESMHDTQNPHSGMVMKKCGMQYEGTMRSAAKSNHGIGDVSMYAILKEDYEK